MNTKNIGVDGYPVTQIFAAEAQSIYIVPRYQREYTWGLKEWEKLFDDLVENEENGYFLGSIICVSIPPKDMGYDKDYNIYEVVDGQQRLTSICLFLAALYTTLIEYMDQMDDDQKADVTYIKNRLVIKNANGDARFVRLIPQIQNHNKGDYLSVLSELKIISKQEKPLNHGNRRIKKAYDYFKSRIDDALNKTNASDKLSEVFKILDRVNTAILVQITVYSYADACTLFESLNNRGMPLTAVDIIKNSLFARLDRTIDDKNLDYYFQRWTEIIEDLGDDYSNQERFFRQNYNAFRKDLNAPYNEKGDQQYPLGSRATRSTVVDIYQKLINGDSDPIGFLDELSENAAIYRSILVKDDDEIPDERKETFLDLQRVQGAPSYLLILYLKKKQGSLDLEDDDIVKICQLVISFFVRRNITNIPPTREMNGLFMSIVDLIEQNNYQGEDIFLNIRNILDDRSAPDGVFRERLLGPVYDDNKNATRFILCMMEKSGMTLETQQDLWEKSGDKYKWTIEHIFPEGNNIPPCWVDMIAKGDEEKAKEFQNQYVHTFGNLTITVFNSNLSNKPFIEKRDMKDSKGKYIGYKNGLNLNADVCDKDEWTVEIIRERTERMVDEIMRMFKL